MDSWEKISSRTSPRTAHLRHIVGAQVATMRAEWKHLFTAGPMFMLTIVALICIPMLYVGFFLAGYWDPYGKTDRLPVAVVNQDTGAELEGKPINVGDQIINQLKQNRQLSWRFVSADEASQGIRDGTYYMRVILPSDMSDETASITSDNPKRVTIEYETTPGKNFIVSLISNEAIKQLEANVKQSLTKAYAASIITSIAELRNGTNEAANGAFEIASNTKVAVNGADALASGARELYLGSSKITRGLTQLQSSLPSSAQLNDLRAGFAAYQQSITELNGALNNPTVNQNIARAEQAVQEISQLIDRLQQRSDQLSSHVVGPSRAQLRQRIQQSSLPQEEKAAVLADLSQLEQELDTTQQLAREIAATISQELNRGREQVAAVSSAIQNIRRLQTAASRLNSGFNQLNTGIQPLLIGLPQVSTAVGELYSGSSSLTAGLATEYGGSTQLSNGLGELSVGTNELSDKLAAASRQLSIQKLDNATVEQIADPVALKASSYGNAPNYGYGLAPYIMSLSLLVGAILFSTLYPVRKLFAPAENTIQVWLAKVSVAGAVALSQALIVGALTMLILGLQPEHTLQYFAILIITALCNMSIVLTLSALFNDIGRFLALLLLVVQLGGSGGTFPVILSNSFFQTISPYLPMTHSIEALRETIAGGILYGSYVENMAYLIVLTLLFNGVLLIGVRYFRDRLFTQKTFTRQT